MESANNESPWENANSVTLAVKVSFEGFGKI